MRHKSVSRPHGSKGSSGESESLLHFHFPLPRERPLTHASPFRAVARIRVQIQIILHFLLVSLPGDRVAPTSEDARQAIAESLPLPPPLSPSKSKKRKRKQKAAEPPPQPLEERLESYMDKLAMWQLMHSVDSTLSRGDAPKTAGAKGKEKERKQNDDDRDWMQAFCEDVVEPLFVPSTSLRCGCCPRQG